MAEKTEFRMNTELMKIMLLLMRGEEASVIVEEADKNESNDLRIKQAKRNYDELTKQINEIEGSDDATFN